MGFRADAYATFWGEPERRSDAFTQGRISISQKDKQSGEYVQDFGGFVGFAGRAVAQKAMRLKNKDRIKIKSADVKSVYNKEKNVTYYNFMIYDFEDLSNGNSDGTPSQGVVGDDFLNETEGFDDSKQLPF